MKTPALSLALALGPIAWIVDFALSVALVPHVHATGSKKQLYFVSAIAAIFALLGLVASRVARSSVARDSTGEELLARFAPLSNAMFLVVIIAMALVEALLGAGV
jgi:hypothetical protein